jgi:hypothetical protein
MTTLEHADRNTVRHRYAGRNPAQDLCSICKAPPGVWARRPIATLR